LAEGVKLFDGHAKRGGVNWVKVSEYMDETRSAEQCRGRWTIIKEIKSVKIKQPAMWNDDEVYVNLSIYLMAYTIYHIHMYITISKPLLIISILHYRMKN
jgi:hypothetical protein